MKSRLDHLFTRSALTLALLAAFAQPAGAIDTSWTGGDGGWEVPTNWTDGVPVPGSNAILDQPGGFTATYANPLPAAPPLNSVLVEGGMTIEHVPPGMLDTDTLNLGLNPGQTGNYQLEGTLQVNTATVVGGFGMGSFSQVSGLHDTARLVLGAEFGGHGAYDMLPSPIGADLQVAGDTVVGEQGNGAFTQFLGTHNVGNDLVLAAGLGAEGTYQLMGLGPLGGILDVGNRTVVGDAGQGSFMSSLGTHNTAELIVGRFGTGDYTQDGGTTTVTNRFVVAEQDGSIGTYTLLGGVLNDPIALVGATVGDAGGGMFINEGGTHNVFGDLVLGNQNTAGGYGVYMLSDDGVLPGTLDVAGSSIVGNEGSGDFQQFSGTHTVQVDLVMGNLAGSSGTYNMQDGTLMVLGSEVVGLDGHGSFSQLAGMHSIAGDLTVARSNTAEYSQEGGTTSVTGHLVVGEQNASNGAVSLLNGLMENQSGATVGDMGSGYFILGGEHQVTGDLVLGKQAGGFGSYSIEELGQLVVSGDTIVGLAGMGDFSHPFAGGSYHETGSLYLGGDPAGNFETGSDGTYDLGGGHLVVHNMTSVGHDGVGIFKNDGGQHTGSFLVLGGSGSSITSSSGTYTLSGNGSVSMDNTTVGRFGYGEFNQSGGVHDVTVNLVVGDGPAIGGTPTREGVYNLYGDGEVWVGGDSILGRGNSSFAGEPGGQGTFTQTGGLHEVGGNLILGQTGSEGSGNGSYNLAGTGVLNVTGSSIVGQGGTGGFSQYGGTHTTGALVLGAEAGGQGTYDLHGGTLNDSAIVGDAGTGVFNNTGTSLSSVHDVTGDLILGNQASGHGTYNLSGDTSGPNSAALTVSGNTVVGGAGTGVFNQSGGTHATGQVQVGAAGSYNLSGGDLAADSMNVAAGGTLDYSGGSLGLNAGAGTLTNAGQVNIGGGGTRTIDGDVENNGSFKITGTSVSYTGTFVNNGAYVSDPSDSYFVDLIVGATGHLVGGPGDRWFVAGDFENHSEQNALWNTMDAYLGFTGGGDHTFLLAGEERGAGGFADNFAWDTLFLGAGDILRLGDGNTGNTGTALYVDAFLIEGGNLALLSNLFGNGINIYYDYNDSRNSYLMGTSYSLAGGGFLNPFGAPTPPTPGVPEPATLALLGLGLAGLGFARRRR